METVLVLEFVGLAVRVLVVAVVPVTTRLVEIVVVAEVVFVVIDVAVPQELPEELFELLVEDV